jgi:hypothetical protein
MNVAEKSTSTRQWTVVSLSRDLNPAELATLRRHVRDGASADGLPITAKRTFSNMAPLAGRSVLARLLAADTTYSGAINYMGLGSGTTAFTNLSTQLNTEVYRKLKSDESSTDNVAFIDWFITSGEVANQTFQEFGAFIDGTASANTGQLFSAIITGGWVKSGAFFVSLSVTFT